MILLYRKYKQVLPSECCENKYISSEPIRVKEIYDAIEADPNEKISQVSLAFIVMQCCFASGTSVNNQN